MKEVITVPLTHELLAGLDAYVATRIVSRSQVIRLAIAHYLHTIGNQERIIVKSPCYGRPRVRLENEPKAPKFV